MVKTKRCLSAALNTPLKTTFTQQHVSSQLAGHCLVHQSGSWVLSPLGKSLAVVLVSGLAVVSLESFVETGTTFVRAAMSACGVAQGSVAHGLADRSASQLENHWLNAVLRGDFAATVMGTAQLHGRKQGLFIGLSSGYKNYRMKHFLSTSLTTRVRTAASSDDGPCWWGSGKQERRIQQLGCRQSQRANRPLPFLPSVPSDNWLNLYYFLTLNHRPAKCLEINKPMDPADRLSCNLFPF